MELDELVGRTDYLEVVVPLSESDVSLAQKRELTRHFLDVSADMVRSMLRILVCLITR